MPTLSVRFHLLDTVRHTNLPSSAWVVTNSQKAAGTRGAPPEQGATAGSKSGQGRSKTPTVHAATALGLGAPPQNTMLSGIAGLRVTQCHQHPLHSRFGSAGSNPLAGIAGFNTGLQRASGGQWWSGGNDLLHLAALLGGSQQ